MALRSTLPLMAKKDGPLLGGTDPILSLFFPLNPSLT